MKISDFPTVDIEVTLAGKPRKARVSLNAFLRFGEITGIDPLRFATDFSGDAAHLAALLWACMAEVDPAVDLAEVARDMTFRDVIQFASAVQVLKDATPITPAPGRN